MVHRIGKEERSNSKELIVMYVNELMKNNQSLTTLNKNIVALNNYLKFAGYESYVKLV
jgi:site-specific recombinase XerD